MMGPGVRYLRYLVRFWQLSVEKLGEWRGGWRTWSPSQEPRSPLCDMFLLGRGRCLRPRHRLWLSRRRGRWAEGNCIKIGLPGKLILSNRKRSWGSPILLKIVSENRFSGKTYFIQLVPGMLLVLVAGWEVREVHGAAADLPLSRGR